ncbi:MAG: hypothetical protein M1820_003018 [Bogoriella megaspora]|nr:MAG: hypothetical protein M1820_003018 [Bogoriella megaspora]
MSQHNALLITELQKPLKLGKRPTSAPEAGEVLIKVHAAGLNPHDSKGKEFGLFTSDYLPAAVLASDLAGTVVSVGPSVTKYRPGDKIFGQSNFIGGKISDQAGLQEYAILNTIASAPIPQGFSFDAAGTLPVNTVASFVALFLPENLGLTPPFPGQQKEGQYKNEAILIIGGGSWTGKYGIQFARMAGFGKIITVAGIKGDSEKKLRELGATHVIDRHKSEGEIEKEVRELVGDELVYVYDPINEPPDTGTFEKPAWDLGMRCLSRTKFGRLTTLIPGPVDEGIGKEKKGGYQKTFTSGMSHKYPDLMIPFWEHLPGWLENGVVQPGDFEVVEGLDAEKVDGYLDGYRDGKAVPKVSVHP